MGQSCAHLGQESASPGNTLHRSAKSELFQGVLLAGFSEKDAIAASGWMQEMEPGFRVSHSTDDMMNELLATALYDSDTQVCPNLYFSVACFAEAMDVW